MYYRMMLPAFSLKELSLRFLAIHVQLGKPHDPSAAGSLFVTVADSSAGEYHRMLTMVSVSNVGR